MILYIDNSEFGKVFFTIVDYRRITNKKIFSIKPSENHKTLELLEKFLKQSKIQNPKSRINRLVVCKGPGSFTGIRVGLSLAQALSLAWKIPLRVLSKPDFVKTLQQ